MLSVFTVMKQCNPSLPDVTKLDVTTVQNIPTPLWFLFDSELDIIARDSLPDSQPLLASSVQERVFDRLGERAVTMLTNFMDVNIITEEVSAALISSTSSSPLGKLCKWSNDLPKK